MNTLLSLLNSGHSEAARSLAAETFVLVTLGFFAGMVISLLIGAWVLHRRATRPKPHRQLLMELDESYPPPRKPKSPQPPEDSKPWEKDGDWWKS